MEYTLITFNISQPESLLSSIPTMIKAFPKNVDSDSILVFTVSQQSVGSNHNDLKAQIDAWSQTEQFDYLLLDSNHLLTVPKLVVFDMDSTLIPFEVIDELAGVAGVKEQVAAVTEAAMQGKLDFDDSLRQRVSTLKGMSTESIEQVKQQLYFNPGIEKLCHYLIEHQCHVAIASGGFLPFAEHLAQTVPFKFLAANSLEFVNSELTGNVDGSIVNATVKVEKLEQWRDELGIKPEEVLAMGDGANDLLMMQAASFGIAYKAKPAVNAKAECVLRVGEADSLIELLEVIRQL